MFTQKLLWSNENPVQRSLKNTTLVKVVKSDVLCISRSEWPRIQQLCHLWTWMRLCQQNWLPVHGNSSSCFLLTRTTPRSSTCVSIPKLDQVRLTVSLDRKMCVRELDHVRHSGEERWQQKNSWKSYLYHVSWRGTLRPQHLPTVWFSLNLGIQTKTREPGENHHGRWAHILMQSLLRLY